MSILRVNSITGKDDNSTVNHPITLSSNTVTLNSGVVFPTGHIINSRVKLYNSGSGHATTSSTYEAAVDYCQISCTVGNTILFYWSGQMAADRQNPNSTRDRWGFLKTMQSTSAVSKDATSSLGTGLNEYYKGMQFISASSTQAGFYSDFNVVGAFIATATTHYLGLVFKAPSTNTQFVVYDTSTNYMILNYTEIQGNVLT